MIIYFDAIMPMNFQEFEKYLYRIKQQCEKQNDQLICIVHGSRQSHIISLLPSMILEICDKVIRVISKEASWSYNKILKDRYSNRKYISDNEILVHC